jgi:selenocysteine lyase/cysteine desulfurase
MGLKKHFTSFRNNTIGHNQEFQTPYGRKQMVYADWIASGRLYRPIEEIISNQIGPFVGNTHTETSENGRIMTQTYRLAQTKIKEHVNAHREDVLLNTGFGMTGAIVKFQRILGLKPCTLYPDCSTRSKREKPVIFITHMEHHSNQTSWYETDADVMVIPPGKDLQVDLNRLEEVLVQYKDRKLKIGSFTACSNVTGIRTPYREMARLMHEHNGLAFIDFAASAPYDKIDMHPEDPLEKLDAIFFSPHKFLGGPGSSGVLVFSSSLYHNKAPDQPGGGTVDWTNPWGEYKFIDDIEIREDGGTPGFLQAIKTAMVMELKEQMGIDHIHEREDELLALAFCELQNIEGLHILADNITDRLGVISFYMESIHYNLLVSLLSDRFGIQVRGGCACAGTYGHYLLDVSHEKSRRITDKIDSGDLSEKPGWVRLSLHPTMTEEEVLFIADALRQISKNHRNWAEDYNYDRYTNEFRSKHTVNGNKTAELWLSLKS